MIRKQLCQEAKKNQNDDDKERFTDDIEVVNMGKQSAQINKEHIHTGAD